MLDAIDVVSPEGLLDESKPVSPDNLIFESLMFGPPLVFISSTKVRLLAADSGLTKVTEIGLPEPTYEVSALGGVINVKVDTNGFVSEQSISEQSIMVKQTSSTYNDVNIRLVAVKQAKFDTQPMVAGQGRYRLEAIVVFVGLEASFNNQPCGGFVLI